MALVRMLREYVPCGQVRVVYVCVYIVSKADTKTSVVPRLCNNSFPHYKKALIYIILVL